MESYNVIPKSLLNTPLIGGVGQTFENIDSKLRTSTSFDSSFDVLKRKVYVYLFLTGGSFHFTYLPLVINGLRVYLFNRAMVFIGVAV
jgi:hypothetical protein